MYIHHIFFIHSLVDRHLGCFHILEVVNSAARNIGVQMSFWISAFFPDIYPAVGLLSHMDILALVSSEISILSSQWQLQFTFPPAVSEGSLFSTSSPAFVICVLFDNNHSHSCEVISHCDFDLHFPYD